MVTKRPPCPGCGYFYAVHGSHRGDCTAREERRLQLRRWDAPNPRKRNSVGRSPRTDAKHATLYIFFDQENNAIRVDTGPLKSIGRQVWVDYMAGNAEGAEDKKWERSCSPGIMAFQAIKAPRPVVILLCEIDSRIHTQLIANLDIHLPLLGYRRIDDSTWHHDKVRIKVFNCDANELDISFITKTDAVVIFNDPNSKADWGLRPSLCRELKQQGVWCLRIISTMGCNANSIKRLPLERDRIYWFERLRELEESAPTNKDFMLAMIKGDAHQWAYHVLTPVAWRARAEQQFRKAFANINLELDICWYRRDPEKYEQTKEFLFLTAREREVMNYEGTFA